MTISRFEDIDAWQDARELAKRVNSRTRCGDSSKDFGLRDQIQRAAGSVMHNIAEGFDSGGDAEFIRFLRYAQRSCAEVQSELYVALDQKYVTVQQFQALFMQTEKVHARLVVSSSISSPRPRPKPAARRRTR
jgi:four helix bundle protein